MRGVLSVGLKMRRNSGFRMKVRVSLATSDFG